jgi:transcriptional regulator with XRE-family HTH domain
MPTPTRPTPTPAADARIGEVLRRLREQQGVSLRTLATRAGFSASFLSQLETGQVSPSIGSLERIAAELGVTLADLFEATQGRATVVVKASARPGYTSSWSRARLEMLTDPSSRSPLEALAINLLPGGSSGKKPSAHAADQFAYLLEGDVTLELGDHVYSLSAGDSVVVPRGRPHRWRNESSSVAQVLLVAGRRMS